MLIHISNKFWISIIFIINLYEVICMTFDSNIKVTKLNSKYDFDVLIFTQRWPVTACIQWMDKSENHVCILPSQKDTWTIHGIWPTRFGSIGPSFCNKSSTFDMNTIASLMDQLEQYWMNIEKGLSDKSFWSHEWMKHGTCASILDELDTENKYFGQGLAWLQQFTMTGILAKANIIPDQQYHFDDIYNGIKKILNRNPSIHCVHEKQTGDIYLAEIRICFNKQLELVDCDGVLSQSNVFNTDTCNHNNQTIHYPSVVPKYLLNGKDGETTKPVWKFPWINLYKLIQIIKWFTF